MVWQRLRFAVLAAGVLSAGAVSTARAEDCCAPAPRCCRTEWVAESYPCTRTVYRTEYKQETYTAYRCECVPETRTRTCTVYKNVPETRTETRTVCVCVPTVEERTVMENHVTCKPVTHVVRRCEDHGHYECREVPCEEEHRIRKWFKRLCHRHDDCCEPCCPPPMKTIRVWVPCKVWVETPVTCLERVCESRPVTCKVTVYKRETRQEQYQVTCCKCVPEQRTETYQVMVTRRVPYQATCNVAVCVPHQETVTLTRMVPRTVEGPANCCEATCCQTTCCKTSCCRSHDCCSRKCGQRLSGWKFWKKDCCD